MTKRDASKIVTKLLEGTTLTVQAGQRLVDVICSTPRADRGGEILVQEGINTVPFLRTGGPVLFNHNPNMPVAKAIRIGLVGGNLTATVKFPDEGVDEDSDWVYGKIKSGLVNCASVGFIPLKAEPIDPRAPWQGFKYLKSELCEFSFTPIPANTDCVIVGRSMIFGASKLSPPSKSRRGPIFADPMQEHVRRIADARRLVTDTRAYLRTSR